MVVNMHKRIIWREIHMDNLTVEGEVLNYNSIFRWTKIATVALVLFINIEDSLYSGRSDSIVDQFKQHHYIQCGRLLHLNLTHHPLCAKSVRLHLGNIIGFGASQASGVPPDSSRG